MCSDIVLFLFPVQRPLRIQKHSCVVFWHHCIQPLNAFHQRIGSVSQTKCSFKIAPRYYPIKVLTADKMVRKSETETPKRIWRIFKIKGSVQVKHFSSEMLLGVIWWCEVCRDAILKTHQMYSQIYATFMPAVGWKAHNISFNICLDIIEHT